MMLSCIWFVFAAKIRFSNGGRVCAGDFIKHRVENYLQNTIDNTVEVVENGDYPPWVPHHGYPTMGTRNKQKMQSINISTTLNIAETCTCL